MKWLVLLFIAVALLAPEQAYGAAPDWNSLVQAAEEYWGQKPPCGDPVYEEAPRAPGILATADMNCEITYDPSIHQLTDIDWCAITIHEVGHLIGYSHSEDQSSPMYFNGPWWSHLPICARFAPARPKNYSIVKCSKWKKWPGGRKMCLRFRRARYVWQCSSIRETVNTCVAWEPLRVGFWAGRGNLQVLPSMR